MEGVFNFSDTSAEAKAGRTLALELIAGYIGVDNVPKGPERDSFASEMVTRVFAGKSDAEIVALVMGLGFLGAQFAYKAAGQDWDDEDEAEMDEDEVREKWAAVYAGAIDLLAAMQAALEEMLGG